MFKLCKQGRVCMLLSQYSHLRLHSSVCVCVCVRERVLQHVNIYRLLSIWNLFDWQKLHIVLQQNILYMPFGSCTKHLTVSWSQWETFYNSASQQRALIYVWMLCVPILYKLCANPFMSACFCVNVCQCLCICVAYMFLCMRMCVCVPVCVSNYH